ncbi:MAG: hypothetical protein AB7O97_17455 [Planctomycetota bacterium]
MRIFLLWLPKSPAVASEFTGQIVADRLLQHFGDLFDPQPTAHAREFGAARMAWLELPVHGFQAPFHEEQGPRFAFAGEYPLNARRLVRERGGAADGNVLLTLCALLEQHREAIVREMIPPGALVAGGPDGAVVHNDGLGQAQLVEYEDDRFYAITNRVSALRTLGVSLRPVTADWAARIVTGWFAGDSTGYAGVRYVRGGSRIALSARGVERSVFDPVGEWVAPAAMSEQAALELGHRAMMDMLTDAIEVWKKPSIGLSGGWDSRTVVSCLRALGAPLDLRVRGSHTNVDVMVAAELARMAGVSIRIKEGGGLPPDTAEDCRVSIQKALRWQGGMFTTLKHKNFLAREGKRTMDGGVVNVMGQHGGIGKADFARKIDAGAHPEDRYEDLLLDAVLGDAPIYLRRDQVEPVRETVRAAYRAAQAHGLRGRGPLHYFFLNEYTRRWGSATVNGQTGLVVAPFLSPNMIRACYAYPADKLVTKPMHRYITQRNAPDWAAFPYEDQVTEDDVRSGRVPPVPAPKAKDQEDLPEWRAQRRRHKFGYRAYWRTVAYPLIDEALEQGGFWTEIFDPDLARAHWLDKKSGGDLIALLHLIPEG